MFGLESECFGTVDGDDLVSAWVVCWSSGDAEAVLRVVGWSICGSGFFVCHGGYYEIEDFRRSNLEL